MTQSWNKNPNTKPGLTIAGRKPELTKYDRVVAGMWASNAPRYKEEEPSATIETAELFWELIRDELEAAKDWKHQAVHVDMFFNTWGFMPDTRSIYKKGAHTLDMSEEGKIKYIGYRAPWIDTSVDLTDGDTLEQLMTWIHNGGKVFPLYRKEHRDGLTWVEHPANYVLH